MKNIRALLFVGLLICFFLLALNFRVSGQAISMWNQTYGGPGSDGYIFAVEAIDMGYAMLGHTYSFGSVDADMWLVKTDLNGNVEWNRTFGTMDYEVANHLIATDDGGYIVVGVITPVGFEFRDVWLIKTDKNGVIPEFSSWIILPFLLLTSLIAVIFKMRTQVQ